MILLPNVHGINFYFIKILGLFPQTTTTENGQRTPSLTLGHQSHIMSKKVTITRKIEARINTSNKDERIAFWQKLREWQNICYQAANLEVSHEFFKSNREQFVYFKEKARDILGDTERTNKEIYSVIKDEYKEFLLTSPQNAPYQLLSHLYKGQIPMAIITSLAQQVLKTFNSHKMDIKHGKRSLSSYRQDMPIPFQASSMFNIRNDQITIYKKKTDGSTDQTEHEERHYPSHSFTLFGFPFMLRYGLDRSNNRAIFERAVSHFLLPEWIRDLETTFSKQISVEFPKNFSLEAPAPGEDTALFEFEMVERDNPDEKGGKLYHYLISCNHKDKEYSIMMRKKDVKTKSTSNNTEDQAESKEAKEEDATKKAKKIKDPAEHLWVMASPYKLCDSSISVERRKIQNRDSGEKTDVAKIFFNFVIQFDKEKWKLDENKTVECYLSPEVPIVIKTEKGEIRIGSKEDYIYKRMGIAFAYRRTQIKSSYVKGGRGRNKKMKKLDDYRHKEKNFAKNRIHEYTRKLIQYCLDNSIKYVILKDQQRKEAEAKENPFLLRNWGWHGTKTILTQKGDRVGIVVMSEGNDEDDFESQLPNG